MDETKITALHKVLTLCGFQNLDVKAVQMVYEAVKLVEEKGDTITFADVDKLMRFNTVPDGSK